MKQSQRILKSVLHWFIGLLCIAAVLLAKWVAFKLSNRVIGLNLSFLGYAPHHPSNPLASYGFVAAVLFALGTWTFSHKQWRALVLTGAGLLLMGFFALLQVAFVHCALLKELADEEAQATVAGQFNNKYLPANFGKEHSDVQGPSLSSSIETVWDRVVAARYFMGFAWYLTVFGGLFFFLYGERRLLSAQERSRITKGTLLIAAFLAILCVARPLFAHMSLVRAQEAESNGDPFTAILWYRNAIRIDEWFAIHTDLYSRIGAIDSNFGRTNTLEYGIYYAELMASQKDFPSAIAEFEKLARSAGAPSELLEARMVEIWTAYGLELYKAGALGSAVDVWQNALAQDRAQWLAGFCLSRAYFETGRYQESINLIRRLTKGLRDPQLIANLHSNLGDAYTRLGEFQQARLAYRYSYAVDCVLNWRGLSSLVGGQNSISLQASD